MKKIKVFLIFLLCLGVIGCKKNEPIREEENNEEEVEEIIEENEETNSLISINLANNVSLSIPEDWGYEIDGNSTQLKLFWDDENKYAQIIEQGSFKGCNTGLTEQELTLNNNTKVSVCSYANENTWNYIYINNNLVVYNYGLDEVLANEVLEIIKTINYDKDN